MNGMVKYGHAERGSTLVCDVGGAAQNHRPSKSEKDFQAENVSLLMECLFHYSHR